MKQLLLILLFVFSIQSEYFVPTKYAFLQELRFSENTSAIAYLSQDVEILLIGFQGGSYNVSIYSINFTSPKPELKGKKGPYANYGFYTNLTDATGNITALAAPPRLNVFGIGSADHIFRIYVPDINNVSNIVKYQELKDSYGPIQYALFTLSGDVLSVVSLEGIVRFYVNQTTKVKAKIQNTLNSTSNSQEHTWEYKLLQSLETQDDITSIAFATNQTTFYIGYDNGSLIGYHYNPKKLIYQYAFIITDTNRRITSIAINDAGNTLITGSQDGFMRVYKTDIFKNNPKISQGIYDANKSITQVSIRRDGKLIVATSIDGWTRIYNFYDKYYLNQSLPMNTSGPLGNTFSSNGDMIATIEGCKIKLYQSCISSISQCSQCSTLDTCTVCSNNYYLSSTDGFCHICSLLQGCKSCVTENMCTSCYSGYFLNTEQGVCEPCVNTLKNCRTCSSKFECTECFLQFKLNNGVCSFPVNPNIPVLVPLSNSSQRLHEKQDNKIKSPSINTHAWTITLIILIIVLCSLIIVMLVVMIVLYLKFMKKLRQNTIFRKQDKLQSAHVPNSQRIILPHSIKDDIKLEKQRINKTNEKLSEKCEIEVPTLQPEEKKEDPFKQLRA